MLFILFIIVQAYFFGVQQLVINNEVCEKACASVWYHLLTVGSVFFIFTPHSSDNNNSRWDLAFCVIRQSVTYGTWTAYLYYIFSIIGNFQFVTNHVLSLKSVKWIFWKVLDYLAQKSLLCEFIIIFIQYFLTTVQRHTVLVYRLQRRSHKIAISTWYFNGFIRSYVTLQSAWSLV